MAETTTFNDLLESGNLSEDVKSQIQEAWESRLAEAKEQLTAELREEFSRQFLHGMSDRIQSDFGPKQLERFLHNKFEFFLEAMGKQGLLRLERGKGPGYQDYQTRYNGTATIEIVSPIAPYG